MYVLPCFSLCNLALTCRRLREVCCSLLEERGLVVQQWKKRYIGSRVTWTVAYKVTKMITAIKNLFLKI
jgi:F-box protein 30